MTSTSTATDIEALSLPGKQFELVRGRLLVREPPGTRHGVIAAQLLYRVSDFARRNALGVVCAQDTGFKIRSDPDTVRAPDLAFIARDRAARIPERGYAELAPDMVSEILSTDDTPGEVLARVADWLDAGTRLVWIIDPRESRRVCTALTEASRSWTRTGRSTAKRCFRGSRARCARFWRRNASSASAPAPFSDTRVDRPAESRG